MWWRLRGKRQQNRCKDSWHHSWDNSSEEELSPPVHQLFAKDHHLFSAAKKTTSFFGGGWDFHVQLWDFLIRNCQGADKIKSHMGCPKLDLPFCWASMLKNLPSLRSNSGLNPIYPWKLMLGKRDFASFRLGLEELFSSGCREGIWWKPSILVPCTGATATTQFRFRTTKSLSR